MDVGRFLYCRECLGLNEQPFVVYKIRTMRRGAERELGEVDRTRLDMFGKIKNDERVTLLGRILRRYWIDETPQLINLVRGEIKLVGIRPMPEEVWRRYPLELKERALKQKPGLMGVQYAFPDTKSFSESLIHMERYLDDWDRDNEDCDRFYFRRILESIVIDGVRSK